MQKILLVDDSEDTQCIGRAVFVPEYHLAIAQTLAEADQIIKNVEQRPDLIVLDISLPDGDGLSYCARLKQTAETASIPIIFLSGRADLAAKLTGFSLGAEDYVSKPFDPIELLARVRARLKFLTDHQNGQRVLIRGDLRIDVDAHEVSVVSGNGLRRLDLTPIDFKILVHFVKHEGMVLSRSQIMNAGWGANTFLGDRTIDVHVSQLRKKIRTARCAIQSIHKVGYKFILREPIQLAANS
jgi:DNA-binding response OmpR family regulator